MNGSMGRFRVPGMMEDINIEEIISRSKRAPAKPKPKTKAKAKPVVKAKAKPKPPTKPRGRPGIMVGEDLANRPKVRPTPTPRTPQLTIGQVPDSVRERFNPAFDRSKIEEIIANARKAKKKFTPFQNVDYTPEYTERDLELARNIGQIPSFSTESAKKFVPIKTLDDIGFVPEGTLGPSVDGPSREELLESMGPIGSPGSLGQEFFSPGSLGPSVDEPPKSREEILKLISGMLGGSGSSDRIRSGIFKDAIYPGDPGYEEALAESKLNDSGGGALFGGGRRLTPELIQGIKEAQEARRTTGGKGLFGLIGGGQRPQAPEIPQWNMMGPQQPINPIVGFQDESQPKYPDIPQFMQKAAGETFGGYGGLSSIKPIMQYAGMGDAPIAPRMPRPRPEYDPDAQPGGPRSPKFIHMDDAEIASKLFRGV